MIAVAGLGEDVRITCQTSPHSVAPIAPTHDHPPFISARERNIPRHAFPPSARTVRRTLRLSSRPCVFAYRQLPATAPDAG
jgi:hypothetical protein